MLSAEDNRLLTQSDAGTPMGELLRRFWLPVLLSEELPEGDGPPKKITVMGEERRAFRLPFVIGVGVFSLILVVAETILGGAIPSASVRVIPVAIIAALALASALRLVALQSDELLVLTPLAKSTTAPIREDEADAGSLARLNDLMEREQMWRLEGLPSASSPIRWACPSIACGG